MRLANRAKVVLPWSLHFSGRSCNGCNIKIVTLRSRVHPPRLHLTGCTLFGCDSAPAGTPYISCPTISGGKIANG